MTWSLPTVTLGALASALAGVPVATVGSTSTTVISSVVAPLLVTGARSTRREPSFTPSRLFSRVWPTFSSSSPEYRRTPRPPAVVFLPSWPEKVARFSSMPWPLTRARPVPLTSSSLMTLSTGLRGCLRFSTGMAPTLPETVMASARGASALSCASVALAEDICGSWPPETSTGTITIRAISTIAPRRNQIPLGRLRPSVAVTTRWA